MMRLVFYRGPGDLMTRIIRVLTGGPYSHVELQFSDGCRFFASGHGEYKGVYLLGDHKVYDHSVWDTILLPASREEEKAMEALTTPMIGMPFDLRSMLLYVIPWYVAEKPQYCSAIVLDLLKSCCRMFPRRKAKISPNGLYRLFLSRHPTMICAPEPEDLASSPQGDVVKEWLAAATVSEPDLA